MGYIYMLSLLVLFSNRHQLSKRSTRCFFFLTMWKPLSAFTIVVGVLGGIFPHKVPFIFNRVYTNGFYWHILINERAKPLQSVVKIYCSISFYEYCAWILNANRNRQDWKYYELNKIKALTQWKSCRIWISSIQARI